MGNSLLQGVGPKANKWVQRNSEWFVGKLLALLRVTLKRHLKDPDPDTVAAGKITYQPLVRKWRKLKFRMASRLLEPPSWIRAAEKNLANIFFSKVAESGVLYLALDKYACIIVSLPVSFIAEYSWRVRHLLGANPAGREAFITGGDFYMVWMFPAFPDVYLCVNFTVMLKFSQK